MDKPKDEPAVDWHDFPGGKEPDLLTTGISELCNQGKHNDCPGHGEYEG